MSKKGKTSIEEIIRNKRSYDTAKEAGDTAGMDAAEEEAAKHYAVLEKSNDPNDHKAAEALHRSGAEEAERVLHSYATEGKTAVRDYMGEALNKEGLSFDQKDLTYDSRSGEVRYKGVSMGTPDYVSSDGVSYMDRERVDEFVQQEFGTSPKSDGYYKDAHSREALQNSRNRTAFLSSLTDGTFRETVGQDIMDHYRYDGTLAAADELADAASYSAGNLDSFGAANASRQMLAYRAAGDQAVRDEIGVILGGYTGAVRDEYATAAGYGQMLADDRTANREDLRTEADITGLVPAEYYTDPAHNPYLNQDGTAKETVGDYAARMDGIQRELSSDSLSPAERRRLMNDFNYLNAARNIKMESSSIAMDAGKNKTYSYFSLPTEAAREADESTALQRYGIDVGKDVSMAGYGADLLSTIIGAYSNERIANAELAGKIYGTDMDAYVALAKEGIPAKRPVWNGFLPGESQENKSASSGQGTVGSFIESRMSESGETPQTAGKAAKEAGYAEEDIRAYLKEHYGISWQGSEA